MQTYKQWATTTCRRVLKVAAITLMGWTLAVGAGPSVSNAQTPDETSMGERPSFEVYAGDAYERGYARGVGWPLVVSGSVWLAFGIAAWVGGAAADDGTWRTVGGVSTVVGALQLTPGLLLVTLNDEGGLDTARYEIGLRRGLGHTLVGLGAALVVATLPVLISRDGEDIVILSAPVVLGAGQIAWGLYEQDTAVEQARRWRAPGERVWRVLNVRF